MKIEFHKSMLQFGESYYSVFIEGNRLYTVAEPAYSFKGIHYLKDYPDGVKLGAFRINRTIYPKGEIVLNNEEFHFYKKNLFFLAGDYHLKNKDSSIHLIAKSNADNTYSLHSEDQKIGILYYSGLEILDGSDIKIELFFDTRLELVLLFTTMIDQLQSKLRFGLSF